MPKDREEEHRLGMTGPVSAKEVQQSGLSVRADRSAVRDGCVPNARRLPAGKSSTVATIITYVGSERASCVPLLMFPSSFWSLLTRSTWSSLFYFLPAIHVPSSRLRLSRLPFRIVPYCRSCNIISHFSAETVPPTSCCPAFLTVDDRNLDL